jgi:hypothetical protein
LAASQLQDGTTNLNPNRQNCNKGYNMETEIPTTFPRHLFERYEIDADQSPKKQTLIFKRQAISLTIDSGSKRFPIGNFTYYLTLFSKFFASFPHGTCMLSISRGYLALDGIYHPLWAAFPNNPTLGKRITKNPNT